MTVRIDANTSDGLTLNAFAKVIEQRVKYLHQTARQSIIASAITVLKSIRAITKVVKPNKIKVNLFVDNTLFASYKDGINKRPCIRIRGTREQYKGKEIVRYAKGVSSKTANVYRWRFDTFKGPRWYLIVANTQGEATTIARNIINHRVQTYKGLAKRALSVLMMKTSNTRLTDKVSTEANSTAMEQTQTREVIAKNTSGTDGKYLLYIIDNLKYSISAVKGGQSSVDVAMKRALNGITAQISKKIKEVDFLGRKIQLQTPFPEVKKK